MKRLLTAALLGVLPVGLAVPAAAAAAEHDVYVETYDAAEHFLAGEAEPCVPWAGTFHEFRTGEVKLVTVSSGPRPGEVHLNGSIDGFVEFIPDDAGLPTYAGTYREKLDGVQLLGLEDELARVAQFRLRSVLHGTDGSRLTLVMTGKLTFAATGDVVIDRFRHTCD